MKSQFAEQRSLRDNRRGVALVGIVEGTLAGRRFSVDGVRVEALPYRDLALLVRPLRGPEVALVGDATWIAREETVLLRLCDRLSVKAALLPARPGTVFASSGDLDAAAEQRYRRWRRALGRVAGKQEWLVLGYAGPHPVPGACSSAPLGKTLTGRRAVVAAPFLDLWKATSDLASHARLIAPRDPRAAFGAAFLVAAEHASAFRALLARAVAFGTAGTTIYHAGPRAPFHFA